MMHNALKENVFDCGGKHCVYVPGVGNTYKYSIVFFDIGFESVLGEVGNFVYHREVVCLAGFIAKFELESDCKSLEWNTKKLNFDGNSVSSSEDTINSVTFEDSSILMEIDSEFCMLFTNSEFVINSPAFLEFMRESILNCESISLNPFLSKCVGRMLRLV